MGGWISLHRKIKEHWVWQDPKKFQWWVDILMDVNHQGRTVNVGNALFECKRGESVKSLKTWADQWKVSKDTARNFLKLLQKDKMITTENLKKTTRLTVCNYDDYQQVLLNGQTTGKRKPNAKQTTSDPNNKGNKENKDKKKNILIVPEEKRANINLVKIVDVFNAGHYPSIQALEFPMTVDNIEELLNLYPAQIVADVISGMDNWRRLKEYKHAVRIAKRWIKKELAITK